MHTASLYRSGRLSPVAWTRAIVMDLGFAGLIEKIEERLGKWVGTMLMCLLTLLVLMWVLRLVFGLVAEMGELSASDNASDQWRAVGLHILVTLVVLVLGLVVFFAFLRVMERRILSPAYEKAAQANTDLAAAAEAQEIAKATLDAVQLYHTKSIRESEALAEKAEATLKEVTGLRDDLEARLADLKSNPDEAGQ
ncbi:MAG: hypothetical protein F4160_14405 [Rhodospirillaceae bacterium]|nr:hypothetical protein [Rhodospirillaceae bacterium]